MFGIRNRKPQTRLEGMGRMVSKRWNRMLHREMTPWQRAERFPMQAGQAVKSQPWIGALAGVLLFAGLAFTFGRRFWPQGQM